MLIILSPSKKLDFNSDCQSLEFSENRFLKEAEKIILLLRKYSPNQLSKLMSLSPSLANLNYERFQNWNLPFSLENARLAIFAFNGDAYSGLKANSFSISDLDFAQAHLRIFSAMYGVILPFDLIKPYRIELGMKLSINKSKSLYGFWKKRISESIKNDLNKQKDNLLINLASEEYFKLLDLNKIQADIISPVFMDMSNGNYKIISSFAKQARGMMARYIIKNKIKIPEDLKFFDEGGYFYSDRQSTKNKLIFLRG